MPIVEYTCDGCKRTVSELQREIVPVQCTCGRTMQRLWSGAASVRCVNVDLIDPREIKMVLKETKHLESRAEDIRNGTLTIKEAGPLALRPKFNRKFY